MKEKNRSLCGKKQTNGSEEIIAAKGIFES